MIPEFPMPIPAHVMLVEIQYPDLECALIRTGMQCCNIASFSIVFPVEGGYHLIPMCQMCFDDMPAGFVSKLEAAL